MKGVIACAAYAGGRRVGDVAIPDISEVLTQPDRFVWIGLHEPDTELVREIQQEFGLHDLAIEDALSAHQRPKLERYGDSLFIVLRTAQLARPTAGVELGETHIFVGPGTSCRCATGPPRLWRRCGRGARPRPRSWPRGRASRSTR